MDPACCFFGICCPPLERRQRMTEYFVKLGADEKVAAAIAEDLIAKIDSSPIGQMVKFVVEEARSERD